MEKERERKGERKATRRVGEKVTERSGSGLSGASRVENGSRTETKVEKVDSARDTHPADTAADT